METSEKTLIYRKDADPVRKLMTDTYLRTGAEQEAGEYVDLNDLMDVKVGDMKTVKVTFTGEGGQLAVYKSNSSGSNGSPSMNSTPRDLEEPGNGKSAELPATIDRKSINHRSSSGDVRAESAASGSSFETASSEAPDELEATDNFMDCLESPDNKPEPSAEPRSHTTPPNMDAEPECVCDKDSQNTDMTNSGNNNNKSDSEEDDVTIVMSGDCTPQITEDEFHFITTHEIQLSELDHDVDYEFGTGSSWEIEDDHQVFSFVDYASFDSDEAAGEDEALAQRLKGNRAALGCIRGAAPVSSLPESDPCASSDESLAKHQNGAGQIHLSIKATSRAINEPSNGQEKENILYHHAAHSGDMSFFRSADTNSAESAKCYIAVPGRLHFGSKRKGKDAHSYSSGASSAVSELDDADKEVRNLTARAFKSLAHPCPYFDAINFSTSSESSLSETMNRWSTYVDLKYGSMNMAKRRHPNQMSHKNTSNYNLSQQDKDGKAGIAGLALASMKAPPVEVFALNGNLVDPKNAASARKKIELMQKLGHAQGGGVITLTETLNFRCNVQQQHAGMMSGSERRAKFAQNAGGSRSTDEVTDTLLGGQGSEASRRVCNAGGETMEGTHKKAIFASSLLKNVISKKMQFEQERKMERGEICEGYQGSSPCFSCQENENPKEKSSGGLQRQGSKYSEGDSDYTIVCLDELGDIVDGSSCDAKDDNHGDRAALTHASETDLESTNEAGIDTKKGAFEASKSTLLRSQNSAFRSWRDGELEFQKEHKSDKTPERNPPPPDDSLGETDLHGDSGKSKLTKMSHLFLPSIQVLSNESEVGKALPNVSNPLGEGGGGLGHNNTLYVPESTARRVGTSKSPEIKISLRSVKDSKNDPFNIANLLTPNIGCNAVNLIKTPDDSKCQALAAVLKGEASDKVPHFTVRDIRENKGKLQTPIHQVRDVRKLVKSSYHFVSLDNNNDKSAATAHDLNAEQKPFKQGQYRNPASLSPIVIKCQSVNTNSNVRQSGNLIEVSKRRHTAEDTQCTELDSSTPQLPPEGARNSTPLAQRPTSRVQSSSTKPAKGETADGTASGLNIETRTAAKRAEKSGAGVGVSSGAGVGSGEEKKTENKMANRAALEKLQAAVKTMEQLYVFDRNEWKRKTEPQPMMDSHVLSLISSEEHGGPAEDCGSPDKPIRRDSYSEKSPAAASSWEGESSWPKTPPTLPGVSGGGSKVIGQRAPLPTVTTSSVRAPQTPSAPPPAPHTPKGFVPISPKLPVSLKISQARRLSEERERERERANGSGADRPLGGTQGFVGESENYLTIPVKPLARPAVAVSTGNSGGGGGGGGGREKMSVYTFTSSSSSEKHQQQSQRHAPSPPTHVTHGVSRPHAQGHRQSPPRRTAAIVMESRSQDTPTATIYHHSIPMAMTSATMATPAQPQLICFSPPVQQVATVDASSFGHTQRKMLLDPTTGSYYLVDTPLPPPTTRRLFDPETGQYVDVPLPSAPTAPPPQPLTPVPLPLSPLAALSPAFSHSVPYVFYPGGYLPSPTLIPTATAARLQPQVSLQPSDTGVELRDKGEESYMESPYYMATGGRQQGQGGQGGGTKVVGGGGKQPLISITSQQGPRIIAPPSFDGTTMSFVVEHR